MQNVVIMEIHALGESAADTRILSGKFPLPVAELGFSLPISWGILQISDDFPLLPSYLL